MHLEDQVSLGSGSLLGLPVRILSSSLANVMVLRKPQNCWGRRLLCCQLLRTACFLLRNIHETFTWAGFPEIKMFGLLELGCLFFFPWKPNKWSFLCVLANRFQKASLYCPVGNKVCLSHGKSSVLMPTPDKWGMSANTPSLLTYKETRFDCSTITPSALLNAFMLWETCTLMLEWNVAFYVSDKGGLILCAR